MSESRKDPFIGIVMLDTVFPRILGDAGNTQSYDSPTRIRIVEGAGSPEIVRDGKPTDTLQERFFAAARAHEADGAVGLVTTCGFMVNMQRELATSVNIPVIASSLVLFPLVRAMTGGRPVGVMTASVPSLGPNGRAAAGISGDQARIIGFEDVEIFVSSILTDKSVQPDVLDAAAIEAAAEEKARKLVSENPDIGAIILECGNLPPYTETIRRVTGRPVFSILDAARIMWQGRR